MAGKLVSGTLSVIEGVFDRVGTDGKVMLAVWSGRLSVGVENDVDNADKLKEAELPGNETTEIEPIVKEDKVGKLPVGRDVVPGKESELSEDKVGKSTEVPPKSTLEKLVVSTLARLLVGIPPGVIELGVVRPGAVKLTEIEGNETLPVKILDEKEGKFVDRLVGSTSDGSERLPVDREPSPDVPSDESPGRLDEPSDESPGRLDMPDVGTATEVASGIRSDALKVPVVYTVTVYGSGT